MSRRALLLKFLNTIHASKWVVQSAAASLDASCLHLQTGVCSWECARLADGPEQSEVQLVVVLRAKFWTFNQSDCSRNIKREHPIKDITISSRSIAIQEEECQQFNDGHGPTVKAWSTTVLHFTSYRCQQTT